MARKASDRWIAKFKRDAVPKLVKEFKPAKVILFGSRIQGTAEREIQILT